MITGGEVCHLGRLTRFWSDAFVLSGAQREATLLGYPRTTRSVSEDLALVKAQLEECFDSFTDAEPDEKDRIHARIDDLLDQQAELESAL